MTIMIQSLLHEKLVHFLPDGNHNSTLFVSRSARPDKGLAQELNRVGVGLLLARRRRTFREPDLQPKSG